MIGAFYDMAAAQPNLCLRRHEICAGFANLHKAKRESFRFPAGG
jgi:hypothetical protein